MPQINDYSLPEVEAQGPVGGISPNLEAAGAAGRGLERLGGAIEEGADVLHRKEAQQEVSETYAKVAKMRADWTQNLYQHANDPDFDTEKFQKDYSDQISEIGDTLNTGEGKDFFNRQAARLGGDLLSRASRVQAQAAGNQAKVDMQEGLNHDSNTLAQSPDQFDQIMDANREMLKYKVLGNAKLAAMEPQLEEHTKKELAKAAIRGWTNVDPGSEEDERPGMATKMLDKGAFDDYLSNEEKTQMYAYAKRAERVADTKNLLSSKAQEKAQKAEYHAWSMDFGEKLNAGIASEKDLHAVNSQGKPILDAEQVYGWQEKLRAMAKQDFKGDPRVMGDTIKKVLNGDITDVSDVDKLMGPKGLSLGQASAIKSHFPNLNDDTKIRVQSEKNLIHTVSAIPKDAMAGSEDLFRERSNQFYTDLQQKKKDYNAQGKPLGDLFDPNNKDYFGSPDNIAKYRPSMTDQMNYIQNKMMKTTLQTPEAKGNEKMRKPGEDITTWRARTKDMK